MAKYVKHSKAWCNAIQEQQIIQLPKERFSLKAHSFSLDVHEMHVSACQPMCYRVFTAQEKFQCCDILVESLG